MSSLTVCPGPTADRRGAVPDRDQTFDLPQCGEPVVARRSLPDRALVGRRDADGAQPRPQRVARSGDAGLRQLGGQPQVRDLVGVLDRAQVVEDRSRLDPFEVGQALTQTLGHPGREHRQLGADAPARGSDGSDRGGYGIEHQLHVELRRPREHSLGSRGVHSRHEIRAGTPQIEMLDPEGMGKARHDAVVASRLVVARGNRHLTPVVHRHRDQPR